MTAQAPLPQRTDSQWFQPVCAGAALIGHFLTGNYSEDADLRKATDRCDWCRVLNRDVDPRGRLEHGFLRVQCETCRAEKLVAYLGKGRFRSNPGRNADSPCSPRRLISALRPMLDSINADPIFNWGF
jgi:hypothetical protein